MLFLWDYVKLHVKPCKLILKNLFVRNRSVEMLEGVCQNGSQCTNNLRCNHGQHLDHVIGPNEDVIHFSKSLVFFNQLPADS